MPCNEGDSWRAKYSAKADEAEWLRQALARRDSEIVARLREVAPFKGMADLHWRAAADFVENDALPGSDRNA